MAGGDKVCISKAQRRLHMRSELAAMVVVAPALLYVATRPRKLTGAEKAGLAGIAALTLAIDGTLYTGYARQKATTGRRRRRRGIGLPR